MKKHTKKLIKIVEWGMFGIVIVLFAIIVSPILPTKEYIASYAVVSGSMEPVIGKGSVAFIRPIADSELQKGSVIAFTHPIDSRTTILHRVVAVDNETLSYQTKGDANNTVDNWEVTSDQVIGQYQFSIPYLGYLANYVRQPIGFALLIGIPALLLLALQIKSIKEGIEHEVQKRVAEKSNQHPHATKVMLLLIGFSLVGISQISAALISSVTINGITISTKETFAEITLSTMPETTNARMRSTNTDKKEAEISVKNVKGYKTIKYTLTYDTDTVQQGVIGEKALQGASTFTKKITLGTCSNDICTYHKNPHSFQLTVTLIKDNGESITITKNL